MSDRIRQLFMWLFVVGAGLCAVFTVTACAAPEADEAPNTLPFDAAPAVPDRKPSMTIVSPANGSTVQSPFVIEVATRNLSLAPLGAVRDGQAHLHVSIDGGCVTPGEVIADDETHVHFGGGGSDLVLDLPPGDYDLCVQTGDGFHVALSISETLSVTVVESGDEPAAEIESLPSDHSNHHGHAESTD